MFSIFDPEPIVPLPRRMTRARAELKSGDIMVNRADGEFDA
jgi:hypothetical protein